MLKYFCCGISKKNNLESENEQFQLLLLGNFIRIEIFDTHQIIQTGPDQSAKFNILEQIANLHNQFTEQFFVFLSFSREYFYWILDNESIEFH